MPNQLDALRALLMPRGAIQNPDPRPRAPSSPTGVSPYRRIQMRLGGGSPRPSGPSIAGALQSRGLGSGAPNLGPSIPNPDPRPRAPQLGGGGNPGANQALMIAKLLAAKRAGATRRGPQISPPNPY